MRTINFGDTSELAQIGDTIVLEGGQELEVMDKEGALGVDLPEGFEIAQDERDFLTAVGVTLPVDAPAEEAPAEEVKESEEA